VQKVYSVNTDSAGAHKNSWRSLLFQVNYNIEALSHSSPKVPTVVLRPFIQLDFGWDDTVDHQESTFFEQSSSYFQWPAASQFFYADEASYSVGPHYDNLVGYDYEELYRPYDFSLGFRSI